DLRGVVVTEVERDVPAAEAGLKAGDVIIEVNRRDTSSLKKFNKVIEKSGRDKVLLLVYRDGNHFYILVRD
ncbi:MAG: PDZ domain-containing protein, partial [Candidatus Krumholzibacteria bacterium]|nr:PDZ domain-containing protein [Candidatus Krumholzibacteria bacterium]